MESEWEINIFQILKQSTKSSSALQLGSKNTDSFIDDLMFVKELLEDTENTACHHLYEEIKYPLKPFYKLFSKNLYRFCVNGCVNQSEDNINLGLNIKNHLFKQSTLAIIQKITEDKKTEDGKLDLTAMENLLFDLRKSDVLVLLGIGRTEGSLDVLPPDLSLLLESFGLLHHPKSKLTVGARALTKHCHRSSEQFWGLCTGTESKKNEHSMKILFEILKDCHWINIHTLPHHTFVLELRTCAGYGLRWSHDGKIFRGFLEPQMENGHEVGWRH